MHIKLRFSPKLINNSSELLITGIEECAKIIKKFHILLLFPYIYNFSYLYILNHY